MLTKNMANVNIAIKKTTCIRFIAHLVRRAPVIIAKNAKSSTIKIPQRAESVALKMMAIKQGQSSSFRWLWHIAMSFKLNNQFRQALLESAQKFLPGFNLNDKSVDVQVGLPHTVYGQVEVHGKIKDQSTQDNIEMSFNAKVKQILSQWPAYKSIDGKVNLIEIA